MKTEVIEKAVALLKEGTHMSTPENTELMIEALLQVKHFFTLIRYESQKQYLVDFMKKM